MKKLNRIKTLIVILELFTILTLSVFIFFSKKMSVLFFTPISKNTIIQSKTNTLKYFYEPFNASFVESLPWTNGSNITYTMNKDTIRSDRVYSIDKPPNTLRIITIGDSFTFGQFVNDNDTYPKQLEKKLSNDLKNKFKNVEVINLGVPGYDPEYAIERYNLRGARYNADYIIWFLGYHNFAQANELELNLVNYYENKLTFKYILNEKQKGHYYPAHELARKEIEKKFPNDKLIKNNLGKIEIFSKNLRGRLIFATFEQTDMEFKKSISELLKRNNNKYIQSIPNIYNIKNTSFPDTHPNQKGYQYISEYISDSLIKIYSHK